MSLGKTLKPIHHTFMCTNNQLKIIVVTKFHDPIGLHNKNLQALISFITY